MNRFYLSDSSKWKGRGGRINGRAADEINPAKTITKFVWDEDSHPRVAQLSKAYSDALAAYDALAEKRSQVEATRKYTPLGISEAVGEHALTVSLPKLRRAKSAVEKVKAEIADEVAKLTLPVPTPEQRAEQEEIRAAMRGMNAQQRDVFLQDNRSNPVVAAAIAGGIPALSGLAEVVHKNIVGEQIERVHREKLGELNDTLEVLRHVEKVVDIARPELREIIGCSPQVFDAIAAAAEANHGELPFRVETAIIDGQAVDVCRVYDSEAKRWRDATPDEITKTKASGTPNPARSGWDTMSHEEKAAVIRERRASEAA